MPKAHTSGQAKRACANPSLLTSVLSCLPRLLLGPSCESGPLFPPTCSELVCRVTPVSSSGVPHCCCLCSAGWPFQGGKHWGSVNLVLRNFIFVGRKEYSFLSLNKYRSGQGTQCWPFPLSPATGQIGVQALASGSGPGRSQFLSQQGALSWKHGALTSEEPPYPRLP